MPSFMFGRELPLVARHYLFRHADFLLAAIVFLFSYKVFHEAPIQQPVIPGILCCSPKILFAIMISR